MVVVLAVTGARTAPSLAPTVSRPWITPLEDTVP